jgi:hypothetical protein
MLRLKLNIRLMTKKLPLNREYGKQPNNNGMVGNVADYRKGYMIRLIKDLRNNKGRTKEIG